MSAAAIKQRLLSLRDIVRQPYNLLLDRYAQERTLYRLSMSVHANRFMVKGGMLVTSLTKDISRATRDIDLRGSFSNDVETVREIMTQVLNTAVQPDGLDVFPMEMELSEIRKDSDYGGTRCSIPVMFGTERIALQIDIGFGDLVYQPVTFDFPALIEGMAPARLIAYSAESVIAEKVEAMAVLGDDNGRCKDFADVVALALSRTFSSGALWTALDMTFSTRNTDIGRLWPAIVDNVANAERERHYAAFLRRAHASTAPPALRACLPTIRALLAGAIEYGSDGIEQEWNYLTESWSVAAR